MFFSFEIGDYVLHSAYGVGRLIALENIEINNIRNEFLKIEYSNSSVIFIPVFRIGVLKLHSKKNVDTKIDELGKSKIFQKRTRLKKEVEKVALELAKIAAIREGMKVDAFFNPKEYEEFKKKTPYELTFSQKKALKEIFDDLQKTKPMDRLLCADVGFGKTEVALHAIFWAAKNKKKSIFLVPTVILAQQHFKTISERLSEFNIKCELFSRFSDIENDSWDVLVTTASNKGIDKFVDEKTGLIILDEEHHFGSQFKENVRKIGHFLQLSATPIPRTLNLALAKIKDISILEEAPVDKKDINIRIISDDFMYSHLKEKEKDQDNEKEFVENKNFDLKDLIDKRIEKNERIFLVVPRVSMIEEIEARLKKLKITHEFVRMHGQLGAESVKENLEQFKSGKAPIMISTNIIESGINIVEANLMVVFHAHMFGISQLHQLKGRIGRNEQFASVYFIIPKVITEIASRRFQVLEDNAHIGGNYSLAIEDLSIRGSGTAIGNKQWGTDYGFGIESYYEILAQAMGQEILDNQIIEFEGFPSAYIPSDFIEDQFTRINLYKKLSGANKIEELDQLKDEIWHFGAIPIEFYNFLEMIKLQFLARNKYIKKIIKRASSVEILFEELSPEILYKLASMKTVLKKIPGKKPMLLAQFQKTTLEELEEILQAL